MAEAQRSAFRANIAQLAKTVEGNDDEAGKAALAGLANLIFHDLDRIADAFERIAEAQEKRVAPRRLGIEGWP